ELSPASKLLIKVKETLSSCQPSVADVKRSHPFLDTGITIMKSEDLAGDLIEGVPAIAAFMGQKPRRTYYLAEKGTLPLFKFGNTWCGRKSTLLEYVAKLERSNEPA